MAGSLNHENQGYLKGLQEHGSNFVTSKNMCRQYAIAFSTQSDVIIHEIQLTQETLDFSEGYLLLPFKNQKRKISSHLPNMG